MCFQTSQNTRKYSYSEGVRTHAANKIDINGTVAQWYNVDAVYRQIGKETYGRDYYSADGKRYHYQLDAAKNNVQEIRTVHDNDNVYMMIRCGNDITAQEGSNWMNVFITAGSPEQKGWNGYEYVINRKGINNGKAVIEKLNSDYSGSDAGEAEVVVRGSFMFLKIPRKAIGMTKEVKSFYFGFRFRGEARGYSELLHHRLRAAGRSLFLAAIRQNKSGNSADCAADRFILSRSRRKNRILR